MKGRSQFRLVVHQIDKACSRLNPGLLAVALVLSAAVMVEVAVHLPTIYEDAVLAAQADLASQAAPSYP